MGDKWLARIHVFARIVATLFLATASGAPSIASASRLALADFIYLGAFRLPEGGERPKTFQYGGAAITFRPGGDPHGN